MKRSLLVVSMLGLLPTLPGCIAWEIRDEIRTTNQHLCGVNPALVHTLHGIEQTNQQIAQTNGQLAEVQRSLALTQAQLTSMQALLNETTGHLVTVSGTLGRTNPTLNELDDDLERMRILNDVHATLQNVHKSLGPLSSAMGSLGGAMSFLGLGDSGGDLLTGDAATPTAAPAGAAAPEPDVAAPAAAPAAPGQTDAPKRQDPILGTWVLIYPPSAPAAGSSSPPSQSASRITVFTADGRFLAAEDGKPLRAGAWSRKARSITLTYDAATPGGTPETESGELLTLNSRTLAIRKGDVIRVHARP